MEYNVIKNAKDIIEKSKYLVKDPYKYKNKWKDLFNNNNPINIELGMGRGKFIIEMAIKFPNINFIGIEINENQMVMATEKLSSKNLNNLKLINIDASKIDQIFGKEINTIYLTFSEPWPKKIDENKRFTHISYLKLYDKIFKKDKHIILKTDNKILFSYSLESLSSYWYEFKKVSLDLHNDERDIFNVMTDFEENYQKENRPVYYLEAIFKE